MFLVGTEGGLFSVEEGAAEPLLNGEVRHVARDGNGFVVVVDDRVVAGATGADFRDVAGRSGLTVHCALPLHGRLLAGTSGAHLAEVTGGSLDPLDSFDAIDGRDEWYTPWGGPPDVRSLAPAPGGGVLVNVHVGGIWRSPDLQAWQQVVETDADVHQVVAGADGTTAFAAASVGFGESGDAGHTWEWTTDGLHATYCRAVALAGPDGDVALVTASTGPSTDAAAVYRRPRPDEPFRRCDVGLPTVFRQNIDTHCLAAEANRVAFGTAEGDVYTSADAGATWDLAAAGLPPVRCVAF